MVNIAAITHSIDIELADIARSVIRSYLDMLNPANQRFLEDPDGREQHQTRWHQWGILTHTRVFLGHFDNDIPRYLQDWGLWHPVRDILGEEIDGASKWDLLRIAILLHDIGKFGARTQGHFRFHFAHHEDLSGTIIRRDLDLTQYRLTERQIEYIAMTAEDHFVLALLRKRAREAGLYDEGYVDTPSFVSLCKDIKVEHPHDFVEVGLMYLGDSLAKADPREGPEDAVSQYEVNIVVARRYLQVVLACLP